MPRTVDEAAHARRRNGFLDAAQRLIETKGYARMTIEDVLKELGTSKGALYHYFDSKQAILEGIVVRVTDAAEAHLRRNAADTDVPALDRLRQFFAAMGQWKVERREALLATLPLWLSDDNAIVRQKLRARAIERITPWLTQIVDQGVREGVFTTRYPDQVGRLLIGLGHDVNEVLFPLLFADRCDSGGLLQVERTLAAYTDALERLLGAPEGSLAALVNRDQLQLWFDAAHEQAHYSDNANVKGKNDDRVH